MSGRLQLASRGLQNEWINGIPTQSHFLFNLKKHTKFAIDTLEIPVTGADYGKESICFIPLDAGDIVTKMTLRYNLKFPTTGTGTISGEETGFPVWYQSMPYGLCNAYQAVHLIDHVDLYIGGMHIQRLTSKWLEVYNKIAYERALYEANKESAAFVRGDSTDQASFLFTNTEIRRELPPVYVDLPFYFHDNLKSALLACKLQKQNCYIKIKFKPLGSIITDPDLIWYSLVKYVFPPSPPVTPDDIREVCQQYIPMGSVSILTTYAYLDTEELAYLKSRPIEHVISQLQLRRFDVPRGETRRLQLNFKNPVKTLYFFVGKKDKDRAATRLIPVSAGGPEIAATDFMENIRFTNAKLLFNNKIVFDDGPEKLIYRNSKTTTYSGMNNWKNDKLEIGSHSFAMYPLKKEPTGHVNFSRIINQEFEITIPETGGQVNECQIYALSYNILHYSSGLCGLKF